MSAPAYLLSWSIGYPRAICADSLEDIYVVAYTNNRIYKYNSVGDQILTWGGYGTGDGQFKDPYGITANSLDNIYVADTTNDRIQKFDSNGNFLLKWGSYGSGAGQFDNPQDISVSRSNNFYVADYDNHRIQKFGDALVGSKVAIVTDLSRKSYVMPLTTVSVGDKVAIMYDSSGKQFCKKL